jgi:hypothetical protein
MDKVLPCESKATYFMTIETLLHEFLLTLLHKFLYSGTFTLILLPVAKHEHVGQPTKLALHSAYSRSTREAGKHRFFFFLPSPLCHALSVLK